MRIRSRLTLSCVYALVAASLLLLPAQVQAQTTGRIFGQVADTSGAALPGATVTISSPAMQGVLSTPTDSEGNFRFLSVPPGTYTVKIDLTGFRTLEQRSVIVGLDRTVTLSFKLEIAGVAESVTVEAMSPVVDVTKTVTGINAGEDIFKRLPVRRDFYDIGKLAPGTTEDATGTAFYGSSGAENAYIIDGLNTTGIELGDRGKTLNFDFIQEIEVKTGGLPAEYGRMTGGVINVLTKSGSNNYRGSFFGFAEGGALQSDDKTRSKRPQTTTQVVDMSHRADAGVELGGFLIKDRLWFFGAYNRVDEGRDTTIIRQLTTPGSPAVGEKVPSTIKKDLYAGKLTFSLGGSHRFNTSVTGDPSKTEGNVFAIAGPSSTWNGVRETGATDLAGKYEGVFGANFMVSGIVARHNESDNITGAGRNTPLLIDATVSPNQLSGGFGFHQDQKFKRDVFKADVTRYLGTHELKGGADYEHIQADNNNYNGGAGQRIYKLVTSGGTIYYRHRFYLNDKVAGFDRSNPSTWEIAVPLSSEPDSRNMSFYAQDTWKIAAGFTLNAGVRWEGQDVRSRDRVSAFKLNENWAPRVGFTWDFARNNRSKVYANWGRFFESVPMDINIRAFGGEIQCFCYNFSPDPANWRQDPNAPRRQGLLGGSTEPVDPDLKGQYIDEILGGVEYEMANNLVIGAKFSRRELGRVIEDFLIPEQGEYFIANPGSGIGKEMGFYDYVHTAEAPTPKRISTAFEVQARKRFSNNWQFLASAVFSKLEGNYDGTFQVSTGQLDPNINSAFDYADFLVNADGRLSNDRTTQLKFFGSYEFTEGPKGLNVGASTFWLSGTPLNAYGYSFAYQNWEYYLVPRGSLGRGPSQWEMDLNLQYPIRLGENRRIDVIADIFNLFNRQSITQLDERYNLIQDGECGGIPSAICNGDGGIATTGNTLTPAGTLSNPRQTATNPDYLKAGIRFTPQRSIRIGARFSF